MGKGYGRSPPKVVLVEQVQGVGDVFGRPKKHDSMAGQVAKLVDGRPWLGWRHRRPMEAYTAARKRNAVIQGCVNGTFAVVNVATGKILLAPMIGFFAFRSVRDAIHLSKDPGPFQAEWEDVRAALAQADQRHAAGDGRRWPSKVSVAVLLGGGLAMGLQAKLFSTLSWSAAVIVGAVLGGLLVAGDVLLHLRHRAGPRIEANVVIDLVALE
jgi:hypothetical protein